MSDTRSSDSAPLSTPALISFAFLGTWCLTVLGLFALLIFRIQVDSVLVGILGGVFTTESAGLAAVTGFWLANSLNSNRANAAKDSMIGQLAGSGPPPPAQPTEGATP